MIGTSIDTSVAGPSYICPPTLKVSNLVYLINAWQCVCSTCILIGAGVSLIFLAIHIRLILHSQHSIFLGVKNMTTITKLYLCIFALTLAQQLFEFSKWIAIIPTFIILLYMLYIIFRDHYYKKHKWSFSAYPKRPCALTYDPLINLCYLLSAVAFPQPAAVVLAHWWGLLSLPDKWPL